MNYLCPSPPKANSTVLAFAKEIKPFFFAISTTLAFLTFSFFLNFSNNLDPA